MKKQLVTFLAVLCISSIITGNAFATTYYVANNPGPNGWGNGSLTNSGLSKATPFLTIVQSLTAMTGGDTLIIANGTYSGSSNVITYETKSVPEGKPGAYTVIKAENDGQVTIDSEGSRACILLKGDDVVDGSSPLPSQDYIEIRGILCQNSNRSPIIVVYANHVRLINVGAKDTPDGNYAVISLSYSNNLLLEGAYAWGSGRYKILTYHVDKSIIRNSVVRFDRANAMGNPIGGFSIYTSTNIEVQNSIAIDGDDRRYWQGITDVVGSFGAPTTYPPTKNSGPVNFTNIIALNNKMRFGSLDWNSYPADVYFKNCVGWNVQTTKNRDFIHSQGNSSFRNCTFGEVNNDAANVQSSYYNGWKSGNAQSTTNNIWYNFKNGGLFWEIETSSYNNIFGMSQGFNIDVNGTTTTNTNTLNPLSNGLTYLPQIEAGSVLNTAGQGGTYIGAKIQKMYGKPGTMWGEPGYNLLQDGTNGQADINLWPFPNEGLIKRKMQEYSYNGAKGILSGDRGFASSTAKQLNGIDDVTLTSYIWEYLGNQIPCNVYSNCSPINTVPPAPTGFVIRRR